MEMPIPAPFTYPFRALRTYFSAKEAAQLCAVNTFPAAIRKRFLSLFSHHPHHPQPSAFSPCSAPDDLAPRLNHQKQDRR